MGAQPKPVKQVSHNVKEARKQLSRSKISMMVSGSAFLTSVCFSLKYILTYDIERAATDGKSVFFNPDWLITQSAPQQLGVLVHEVWHVALNHCKMMLYSRMGERDPQLWNIACDSIINCYAIDAGFTLPEDRIDMPQYRGWSAERVYDDLVSQATHIVLNPAAMDLLDPPLEEAKGHIPSSGKTPTPSDQGEMDEDLKQILLRASVASRMAGEDPGNLPGDLQFVLNQITNPKLPWDRLLLRHCRSLAKTLYSFAKPNRRYYPAHYIPTRHGQSLGHVGAAIDLSYSVNDEQIQTFVGEISGVLRTLAPKQVDLVEFDEDVRNVTTVRSLHQLRNHTYTGRGGTDITPVIQWANKARPDVLIIFTDGEFYPPLEAPLVPVIWVIYNNSGFTSEHGKVIHVYL